jgi:hypothetical protein
LQFLLGLLERLYARVSWLWLSGRREVLLVELRAEQSRLSSHRLRQPFWLKTAPRLVQEWASIVDSGVEPAEALRQVLDARYVKSEVKPPIAIMLSTHGVRTILTEVPPLELVGSWIDSNFARLMKLPIERSDVEIAWHRSGETDGRTVCIHVARRSEIDRSVEIIRKSGGQLLGVMAGAHPGSLPEGEDATTATVRDLFFQRAVVWKTATEDLPAQQVYKAAMHRVVLALGLTSLLLLLLPTVGATWLQGKEDATAEIRAEYQAARASVTLREKEVTRVKREIARLEGRLTSANTTFYFQKIAEALPPGLRVTRLSIDRNATDGALVIAGEIRSDVDLVRFIDALDRTRLWSEVRLMRASQAGGFGAAGTKTFEIRGKR